jgi:hypothetical protein
MDTLYLWHWNLPDLKGKLKPSRWQMTEEAPRSAKLHVAELLAAAVGTVGRIKA